MAGVVVLSVILLGHLLPEHTYLSVLCGAVVLLILFAGNEHQVRPLVFIFKPLIRLVKWLGNLLQSLQS